MSTNKRIDIQECRSDDNAVAYIPFYLEDESEHSYLMSNGALSPCLKFSVMAIKLGKYHCQINGKTFRMRVRDTKEAERVKEIEDGNAWFIAQLVDERGGGNTCDAPGLTKSGYPGMDMLSLRNCIAEIRSCWSADGIQGDRVELGYMPDSRFEYGFGCGWDIVARMDGSVYKCNAHQAILHPRIAATDIASELQMAQKGRCE